MIRITKAAAICNLGENLEEIFQNIIDGKIVDFKITTLLPEIHKEVYNIRCNRMLLHCLNKIQPDIEKLIKEYGSKRIGVVFSTTNTGIDDYEKTHNYEFLKMSNPAEFVKDYLGLEGLCCGVSTACSSGIKAFLTAKQWIECGLCDAVIAGGTDEISQFPLAGFKSLEVLSEKRSNPFSKNSTGINISEATENIRVELVRLLGRVDVVVSSDRDRTISSFTMKNFATKVPLFDGDASLEATEDVTISFDNVAINASSTHEFSFYVNETLNESANTGGFAVSLTTGDATLEGSTPINKTIPRNSVLPLKLSLSDYQLQIKVMAQVAPIGGYPVNVYQTAYSLTNDYAIESLPEGCTFTIDGSLIYMDGTEISGDWSWAWNLTDEDDKYIQLDGSGTEKPVNGHIAALQDDTSHALSFSVTYQGEVIREGTLTINKIGALGDNYPQTRATDWSAAPRWYIPVALTRNP